MRQLILNVPQGNREKIFNAVDKYEGIKTITIPNGDQDVFIIFLPDHSINNFLLSIGHIPEKA